MISHDERWWILQSGEYVLGTLAGPERDTFTKLLEHDADARRYVVWWQERLAHLDASVVNVTPPAHVWKVICQQLNFSAELYPADTTENSETPEASAAGIYQHRVLDRHVTLWRGLAGLATAAALLMAVVLWQNRDLQSTLDGVNYDAISIVREETGKALWVINASISSNHLHVAAVAPPELASDKSYELWLVSADQQTVSSLGLLPATAGESVQLELNGLTDQGATFAVSLEPKGGSPGVGPSGPVMFNGTVQQLNSTRT